jgi:hypothetical protein
MSVTDHLQRKSHWDSTAQHQMPPEPWSRPPFPTSLSFPPFSYFYSYDFVPPLPPLSSPPKDLLRFSNQAQIRLLARLQPRRALSECSFPQVRSVHPQHFTPAPFLSRFFASVVEILLGEIRVVPVLVLVT